METGGGGRGGCREIVMMEDEDAVEVLILGFLAGTGGGTEAASRHIKNVLD